MNKVSVIGTGYVGLVTGTCLSEFGMEVICMDVNAEKIEKLKEGILPIYEPGLDSLVKKNCRSGRLKFTTDMKTAVEKSTTIFIAVGTPPQEDGSADLAHVEAAAREIARYMNRYKVIVNKSTVPVGTARQITCIINEELSRLNRKIEFDVVSNPEFLREGAAVRDFMHPDRVVIGTESEKAREILKNIYNVLYLIDVPFVFTNWETAELIKYASNAFLATKISFINEISNLCDKVGADVHHVAKAMGMDGRIGSKFLHAGPGYGGSCFPKDTQALIRIGQNAGVDMKVVAAAVDVNNRQIEVMVDKIEKRLGNIGGKTISILGLAFKPETDDIRESPAIKIIQSLLNKNAVIKAFDPIAVENARTLGLKDAPVIYCEDEYSCAQDSNAVVLMTEWNQFRNLDLERIKKMMRDPNFFDLRNVYEPENMKALGFYYEGVGRR
ncbi:MAG: UDP-glucose/GDP-mannose dehydrogenase family protein [Clostridiales bacterium]|jgi:UDPglucose 6-dehydrogenase|nr:UDP-glucose/GDP-mannose dehydrogenase family protein [Eubacteriales bacterium]MDH7565703.1 UDP-glucose/GDP-mannose dehydrogenase family protein [Clostridiales bacterium]